MEDPKNEEIWFEAHREEVEKLSKDCSCCAQKEITKLEMDNAALYHAQAVSNQQQYIISMMTNVSSKNPLLNEETMMNRMEFDQSRFYSELQNVTPPIFPNPPFKSNDSFIFIALGYLIAKFGLDKRDDQK